MDDPEENHGLLRSKSENHRSGSIGKLGRYLNLTPMIAEAFYQRVASYFGERAHVGLSAGEAAQ